MTKNPPKIKPKYSSQETEVNEVNHNLPLIFVENTKTAKTETALDKEINKYNNYLKEIAALEQEEKNKKAEEETYNKMYINEVVPQLKELAEVQLLFVKHIDNVFYGGNPGKKIERIFIDFVEDILEQAAIYLEEARELLEKYEVREFELLTKSEKKQFEKWEESLKENEIDDAGYDEYDLENDENYKAFENFFNQPRYAQPKKPPQPPTSVNELYKELVKIIHPDKELKANIKEIKTNLMVELNDAKQKKDLFAMLLIKQKAHKLNNTTDNESQYSLQQLKDYNKVLKQKLEMLKQKTGLHLVQDYYNRKKKSNYKPNIVTPAEKLVKQITSIKRVKKDLTHNIKNINFYKDVEMILYSY